MVYSFVPHLGPNLGQTLLVNGTSELHWAMIPFQKRTFHRKIFEGNFVQVLSKLYCSDRYEFVHMARQLCCRGMYIIS